MIHYFLYDGNLPLPTSGPFSCLKSVNNDAENSLAEVLACLLTKHTLTADHFSSTYLFLFIENCQ